MRCNTDIFPYSSMLRITFRVNILCIMFNIIAFYFVIMLFAQSSVNPG